MGNETRKTNKARGLEFIEKYFQGKVIDIGGGSDPVIPDAKVFDLKDGDAQYISKYEKREYYDCVHSSHCLMKLKFLLNHTKPETNYLFD